MDPLRGIFEGLEIAGLKIIGGVLLVGAVIGLVIAALFWGC